MKKVLFTATVDSHILQFHLPFLKLFKEQGYEVHVATNGDEVIPYCDKKIKISFERSPIKINNLKAIKELKKVINEEKYDIIHCHTPMGSVVTRLAAKYARKKYHTRVIYTAHGFHFFKGAPLKNWLIFYPVEKYLSKYTDTLITINQEDYELAKNKFKKCHDIQYVPGVGIDEEKFNFKMTKKEKSELRKSLGLKDNDFVLTCVARLDKNKNQGFLIDVMKELIIKYPNIHLLLVGPDELNGLYQEQAKDILSNVHFLGYRKDIPELLKITDVSVSSSLREGLPVNILEAMASGIPVVATDARGVRDLIKDGKNGYVVEVNSKEDFINGILKLYNDSNLRKTISNFNLNDIKNYYLDTILDSMKKIYKKRKTIAYLRSNSITNDSRCIKEVESLVNNFDFNVMIFCWDRENILNSSNDVYNNTLKNDAIKIFKYRRKSKYGSGIKNIFRLILFNVWLYNNLKNLKNCYDTIHSCDLDTGFVAKIINKKYSIKYIYDIFDYYSDSHNCLFLKKYISKLENEVINSADSVIICNEWRKKQIALSKPRNLFIIHNSPDINIKCKKSIIKSKSDKLKICYVGILQDNRLLLELLNIFKSHKNNTIELHIGGFGKYANLFEVASLKYNNIYYYGRMDYSSTLSLENDCDILFATYNPEIPNHAYSAPNKLYEAMALGKPIIVCKNTGVDNFVKANKLGYVINYDADEFLNLLKKIDKSELSFYCKTSKKLYNEHYRWNVMFEKMKDRY